MYEGRYLDSITKIVIDDSLVLYLSECILNHFVIYSKFPLQRIQIQRNFHYNEKKFGPWSSL